MFIANSALDGHIAIKIRNNFHLQELWTGSTDELDKVQDSGINVEVCVCDRYHKEGKVQ
jgi:hypothetical protein